MTHEQVAVHLGLHPMSPLHSGTFLRLDWFTFRTLATGLAPREV